MRYEKGHKDTSRQRIMDVAAERFRSDGIAASGLAGIMSDAGLTNGAFYPHFKSKADLVRDSLAAAMEDQSAQLRAMVADGGLEAVIAAYLSPEHRDNPQIGCTLSALLPELARQPLDTRIVHMERILDAVSEMAAALPGDTGDREAKVIGIYATLIGTLQLARAVHGTPLSERVLAAGADAARELVHSAARGPA
jgi:AcrR family transcriptional regulator